MIITDILKNITSLLYNLIKGNNNRMTTKYTEWSPDTCDCILKYSFDDSLPPDQIVNTISFVKRTCQFHQNLLPNAAVTYSCILDENQKKNNTLQLALDNLTSRIADTFINEDGSTYVQLKNNIAFNFSFSGTAPNRVLTVSFLGAGLTTQEKNSLQTKLNNKFGAGVVLIV